MSKLSEYLDKARSEKILIQGLVPRELADRAKVMLDKRGISWSKFIIACLQQYLDEETQTVDRILNNAYASKEKRK